MKEEIKEKIKNTLPTFVYENLYEEHTLDANGKIICRFINSDDPTREERIGVMKDILGLVTLKEIRLEDLVTEIESRMMLDGDSSKQVALIMLREVFFPVKDFFPGIEDEIVRLGGEIPKETPKTIGEQFLKREQEIEDIQARAEEEAAARMADTTVTDSIENLMAQFPEAGEMVIGTQKAITVKNMPVEMKPMIKYWIADYKEKMGYYKHTNLDRVQYVCHDKNTRNMNEEERRELNLVLKSVDEGIPLPYSTKRRKIDFSQVEE